MPTFMQKIRLALRGWSRRREEKNREFLARNVSRPASAGQATAEDDRLKLAHTEVDIEGLTVAYLDGSGRTTYYLDTQTGDVIESNVALDGARYRPIPSASHEDDRQAFLLTIENTGDRMRLTPAATFREVLAGDRRLEKSWFNFRSNRAIEAIQRWLHQK